MFEIVQKIIFDKILRNSILLKIYISNLIYFNDISMRCAYILPLVYPRIKSRFYIIYIDPLRQLM